MTAQASRRRVVEIAGAAVRASIPTTRSARFVARSAGRTVARPSFHELTSWPCWPGADVQERTRIWQLVALIAAHDAIGNVIDGERLRAYAALVGDDALEAVLMLPAGGNSPLVAPERLAERGRQLCERGLPQAVAAALDIAGPHADTEHDHVLCAERIARENPV